MNHPDAGNVLLTSLNVALSPEQKQKLETTPQDTWAAAVDLALQYRIGPLLQSQLTSLDIYQLLPTLSMERLQNAYRFTVGKNLRLNYELKIVLSAFAAAAIPVIVLKGAFLVQEVYSNIALRTVGDIDILVHEADLSHAVQVLRELGYKQMSTLPETPAIGHHLPRFIHNGNVAVVELHWQLLDDNPLSINTNELWEHSIPMVLVDTPAKALAPEDLLLHICCHAVYGHGLNQDMRFLIDITKIVEHYQSVFRWQTFAERAHSWRCSRGVYLALFLAQQLLGAACPAEVFDMLVPHNATRVPLEAFMEFYFTEDTRKLQGVSVSYAKILSNSDRLYWFRLLLGRIFLSREVIGLIYDKRAESPQIYVYYVVRIKDLIKRYFKRIYNFDPDLVVQAKLQQQLLQWVEIDDDP